MVLRTIISVNQLSIYGAVVDICDELVCRISGCPEDGAVEFRILAQMFRSEFTSSQPWSSRAWVKYVLKGGGPKKRFQYCVIHSMLIPSHTFESGGKHINPTLQDSVLLTDDFAEHIYHDEGSPRYALDHSMWIDSVWQRRQERETCSVLYGSESNIHRSLSRK